MQTKNLSVALELAKKELIRAETKYINCYSAIAEAMTEGEVEQYLYDELDAAVEEVSHAEDVYESIKWRISK